MSYEKINKLKDEIDLEFNLKKFGFPFTYLTIRNIDWQKKERDEDRILENLESHLKLHPLTRRERYGRGILGEILGRLFSGMFKQRQDVLHVRTPQDAMLDNVEFKNSPKHNWKTLFDWFKTKYNAGSKVFIAIDSPQVLHYKHKNYHKTVIEEKVRPSQRRIVAIFINQSLLNQGTISKIYDLGDTYGIKVFNIENLRTEENFDLYPKGKTLH